MSMPMEEVGEPQQGPQGGGGGDPIQMLLGLVTQAAQAIDQVGQTLAQLAGPQGPPPGAAPPGGARAAAMDNMIQRGG
jgi:hypothetical protein